MVGGKEGTSGSMLSFPAIEVRDNEDINEIEIMRRKWISIIYYKEGELRKSAIDFNVSSYKQKPIIACW